MLIAALLELKSRLLLPGEEIEELIELDPGEAAEELLARLLDAQRYRAAAAHLRERARRPGGLPVPLGAAAAVAAARLAVRGQRRRTTRRRWRRRSASCSRCPSRVDVRHMVGSRVTVAERLAHLRALLRRGQLLVRRGGGAAPTG